MINKGKDLHAEFRAQVDKIEEYLESCFPGGEISDITDEIYQGHLWLSYRIRFEDKNYGVAFARDFIDQPREDIPKTLQVNQLKERILGSNVNVNIVLVRSNEIELHAKGPLPPA